MNFSFTQRFVCTAGFVALLLFNTAPGLCAEAPINIEADRMVSQEDKNTVIFTGNVEASQGGITIRTDEMTVLYEQENTPNKEGKKQTSKVKKLVCVGNVEVQQEDWLGTGARMDYFAEERKIILTGDAKAWQGKNMVSGKTIIYYLDEKRSEVEQDRSAPGGRVRAIIQQQ
jgi:lipopolysaccharide export system protein LptA